MAPSSTMANAWLVQVIDRNHVKVVLAKTGAGWMDEGESGDLFVKVVNTGAGLYPFEKVCAAGILSHFCKSL